jgi:FkbM family methyltransferase
VVGFRHVDSRGQRYFRDCGGLNERQCDVSGSISSPANPQPTYGWGPFFTLIKRHGFAPRTILDVGANHGNWTRDALGYFPDARFVLVEPQDNLKAHVQDLMAARPDRMKWFGVGASDRPGRLPLTIAPQDVSSNFGLTPEQATALGYQHAYVDVRTINDLMAETGWPIPEMVKIDAEGFDLKALAGASNLIGKTDIFFLEAAVCAGGIENTMVAVVAKMNELGYRMIDITDINRSPKHGVLWLCELAFMRNGCPLLDKISAYQ